MADSGYHVTFTAMHSPLVVRDTVQSKAQHYGTIISQLVG